MSVEIPHLAFPMRLTNGSFAVNEQDSDDDIVACVGLIASFPTGSRIDKPDFGVPDQTFRQGGADPAVMLAAINQWEPRAAATASVDNSDLAERVSRVTVAIQEAD